MTVYFISGLAADERAFCHIRLPRVHKIVHLPWKEPLKGEDLVHYSIRMAEGIDTSHQFALVGLSMGGMVATEIAKVVHPSHTIIISSIPTSDCLPSYFRLAGRLGLHRVVPVTLIKKLARAKRLFTTETNSDKNMLRLMIDEADPVFIKWALKAIISWRNTTVPQGLVHIHGSRDEVLPLRFTRPQEVVQGGGHLMIMTKARKINQLLESILGNSPVEDVR